MGFWTQIYTSNFEKYFSPRNLDFFGTFACLITMTIIPFQNNFLIIFFLSMDSLCGNSNPHTLQLSVYQVIVVKTGS